MRCEMSKKVVCDYLEFVNQIKEITEDTLFVIKGDWIPLSEETIKSLNAPQDKVNDYFECNEDGLQNYGLNEVSLVLSGVKEGIQIELDLSEFENFGFDFFSFENISSLKGIILPDTLENLGPKAFYECKNLEYVIIPAGLCERINEFAFDSCPKLAHIKIEKELDVIEDQSVIECKNLQLVEYPKRDANYYYLNPAEFKPEEFFIETPRLILRPLLKKDYETAVNYYLDPRVTKYEERILNPVLMECIEAQDFSIYFTDCIKTQEISKTYTLSSFSVPAKNTKIYKSLLESENPVSILLYGGDLKSDLKSPPCHSIIFI